MFPAMAICIGSIVKSAAKVGKSLEIRKPTLQNFGIVQKNRPLPLQNLSCGVKPRVPALPPPLVGLCRTVPCPAAFPPAAPVFSPPCPWYRQRPSCRLPLLQFQPSFPGVCNVGGRTLRPMSSFRASHAPKDRRKILHTPSGIVRSNLCGCLPKSLSTFKNFDKASRPF